MPARMVWPESWSRETWTVGSSSASRRPSKDEPFSALAFKIAAHPFFGKLTYIRVYSGRVAAGSQVINSTKDRKERIGKIFQMHASKENPVDEAMVGHIYAVIGLKDTTTGDTLSDPQSPIVLESMTFPDPVILEPLMAVEVRTPEEYMGDVIGDLRSKTSGRAVYSMEFDSYAEVPRAVADEIVQKAKGE